MINYIDIEWNIPEWDIEIPEWNIPDLEWNIPEWDSD